MRIDPQQNPELLAMLHGANRPDLIREGFEVDEGLCREALEEQDRLHPGTTALWKEAHAFYSVYFRSRPKPAAQIELDAAASPEEGQTKVLRALNAFLADSAVTRETVTGGLRSVSSVVSEEARATRDTLEVLKDLTVTVTNKSIDRITGSLSWNTEATTAAAGVIASATQLAADQISENERQTAVAVRDVRDRQGETNQYLSVIGRAVVDLTAQSAKSDTAQRSLLLDAKNEAAESARSIAESIEHASSESSLRAALADKTAQRQVLIGWLQLVVLVAILLLVAVQGRAQTPVAGIGTAGTPKGGVVTVQGASGGTALPVKVTDGTSTAVVDPCSANTKSFYVISLTSSAQVITGVSAKKIYICSINIVAAAATNVALVEGTGTVCATSIAGMAGGSTAATGWNFAANGGLTLGSGSASVMATATAADNACLLLSASNQVSGTIAYVVQ